MAVPTITSVSPAVGHPGGGTVVSIVGTGFQLPPPPPSGVIPVPEAAPTVRVFFGSVEARRVRVASSTQLYVTTERGDPATVDVEVRNVGPFGETLGSEHVAATAAFEFRRPDLTNRGVLQRVVRQLIVELRRQVHDEVVLTEHIDWPRDPEDVLRKVSDAKVPCVWLSGPTVRENRVYMENVKPLTQFGTGLQLERRPARTVDLVFGIGALANKESVLLELTHAITDFFHRNPWLYLPFVAGDSEPDGVRYDLQAEVDQDVDSSPSETNVRSSSGTIAIAGVDLLGLEGYSNDMATTVHPEVIEDVDIETDPA